MVSAWADFAVLADLAAQAQTIHQSQLNILGGR